MAVDGYLNFDTKISTTGFDNGTAKITAKTKSTASQVTKTASQTSAKIQAILDDTERSNKSKAASIAAIYRKEGMEISEAMEKAWSQIERGSTQSTKKIRSSLLGLKPLLSKLAVAASAMFSTYALVNFGKQAIQTASDIQEVQNVVDVSFGHLSSQMEAFADKAIQTYGISKLTAKQTGSTYMAMAKGMQIADDAASDMALTLTGLSADMASFYNKEQSVTATALNSVFTGETETLKAYGIVMTEANLQNFAYTQGINKKISAMSQAEKVQLRYNYVLQQTALAQGDFVRTQDGWANQTRILTEQWKEFSGTVGTILMNTLLPAVQSLNKAMLWLNSVAQSVLETLAAIFDWDISSSGGSASVYEDVSNAIGTSVDNQNALTDAVNETAKAQKRELMGFDKINKLSDDSSSSSTSSGSVGGVSGGSNTVSVDMDTSTTEKKLNGFLVYLTNFKQWCKDTFLPIYNEVFKPVFDLIGQVVSDTIQSVKAAWDKWGKPIWENLKDAVTNTVSLVKTFWESTLKPIWDNLITGLREIWDKHLKPLLANVLDFIGELINGALEIYNEFISPIIEWFCDRLGPAISSIFNSIVNVIKSCTTYVTDIIDSIITVIKGIVQFVVGVFTADWKKAWEGVKTAFSGVVSLIKNIINGLKTFFSSIWKAIKSIFSGVKIFFKTAFEGAVIAVKAVWSGIKSFFSGIWSKIKSIFAKVGSWFSEKFNNAVVKIKSAFSLKTIKNHFSQIWTAIKNIFANIPTWFLNTFSNAWQKVKNVFSKGGEVFSGIKDGILSALKTVINGLISGINKVIAVPFNGINTALSKIKNISIAGSKPFYDRISLINVPQIPKLATGTVVPANYGEFLAILGDNKREPEIVSPESAMRKVMSEELKKNGGGTDTINLTVELDGEVVYRKVVKKNKQNTKMTGVNALA